MKRAFLLLCALCVLCAWAFLQAQTTNPPSVRTSLWSGFTTTGPGVGTNTPAVIPTGSRYVNIDTTTGVITWPTNFWSANSNLLNATVAELAVSVQMEDLEDATNALAAVAHSGSATDLSAGTLAAARLPDLYGARVGGTNVMWVDLLNARDTALSSVLTITSNYYGPTLLYTSPLYVSTTDKIAYWPCPGFFKEVSSSSVRALRTRAFWLPGFQNFRLTGYWCSTNSDSAINLWRRVGSLNGAGVAQSKDGTAAFNYSSTTTNTVEDVTVLSLAAPAAGPVYFEYGLNTTHGLDETIWLLGLKVEYW